MQFTTWIEADVPRVECALHGVKQLRVPWAEPGSQFTARFERLAIGLEGVNAVIQWVKKTAQGFRNAERFKTAIYFHCGGLDLCPHESR